MSFINYLLIPAFFQLIDAAETDDIGIHNIAFSQNTPAWVNMTILQRVLHYDWSKELVIFGSIVVFLGLHYYGKLANQKKVDKWMDAHKEVLESEFFQVGVDPVTTYSVESPVNYVTYATGRLNIDSLTGTFILKGRQNIISLTLEYILSFFFSLPSPVDSINITITPNRKASINSFVFAIVNKEIMKRSREQNYFLSLTKTSDSTKLPPYLVFMSENPEVTEALFASDLAEAVQNSQNVLDLLALSDQRKERPEKPEDTESIPSLTLTLKFPQNEEDAKVSAAILSSAIRLVDTAVEKTHLRPEVVKKIKATREVELKKILKAQDEIKAEELAKKKAEEKRDQRNRLSKLSPAEQKKAEEKERQKEQRKLRQKQMKRG